MSVFKTSGQVPAISFLLLTGAGFIWAQGDGNSPSCNVSVGIDLTEYTASGVGYNRTEGVLDSCTWRVKSLDNNGEEVTVDFGEVNNSTFFSNGEMDANRRLEQDPPKGLYFYKTMSNPARTVIWVKPGMNVFSPGSLTARLKATNSTDDFTLSQQWFYMRRNSTNFTAIMMNAKYHVGGEFNEASLKDLYSFNTTNITTVGSVMNRCYKVTVPNDLLMSDDKVFIHYEINDLNEANSDVIRDDIALDFPPDLQGTDTCMSIVVSGSATPSATTTPDPTETLTDMIYMPDTDASMVTASSSPTATTSMMTSSSMTSSSPTPTMTTNSVAQASANIALALGAVALLAILSF